MNTPLPGSSLSLVVPPELDGQRLDSLLAALVPGLSRSAAAHAVEGGFVALAGVPCLKTARRLATGDLVQYTSPPLLEPTAAPEDLPLNVLYEDGSLAVLDKAPGMVVHPARGHASGTLVNALVFRWGLTPGVGDLRPGIVHRLDKGTSGLLVVARNAQAKEALQQDFLGRRVEKIYLALCLGVPKADAGFCDAPIERHPRDRKRYTSRTGEGRSALTEWKVLHRGPGLSLLAIRLHTGRTHQIRVHLSDLGFPVACDEDYGGLAFGRVNTRPLRDLLARQQRPLLHATSLAFTHPVSGDQMRFCAPPPPDMQEVLAQAFGAEARAELTDSRRLGSVLGGLFGLLPLGDGLDAGLHAAPQVDDLFEG
jgi:23S rRNA pseudouridine1911/1915/1917 synthase